MTDQVQETADVAEDALLLAVKGLDTRVEKLEADDKKTLLKTVTTSASTSALLLGLVLTFASLYDVFIAKPEADRISRISQFNQAVNSAAKTRQELVQLQMQTSDNQLKLAAAQIATPRVLNDISTARVILKDLKDQDVGVPQLIVLTSEAFTAGDWESAKLFVERAVAKTDVSPFLRSEAKRYEARYFYASGQVARGRQSYESALSTIGESQASAAARAYILADFSLAERTFGDCPNAIAVLQRFAMAVNVPGVFADARAQLVETVRAQINQWPQGTCPLPDNLAALKGP